MAIRVLLVDDHTLMRHALRMMLENESDLEVVGDAGNGETAIQLCDELSPDVVVIDVAMPGMGGIAATRSITQKFPDIRVLALTTYSDKRFVNEMLAAGAAGYVVKSDASDQLIHAIHAVHEHQHYFSPEVATGILDTVRYLNTPGKRLRPRDALGRREREVLALLSEGKSSVQIGNELHIAASTVDVHRRNIMRKLNLHTVAELTKFAIREGLTTA